ncbi:hypothetical protein INT45_009938 [Circinella minor]|uniref:Uncharacterized protein n=1 Tax=Circinella minor TaxID=1195481 RepID=A0A8H7S154_9FUNG|nr:hypothetical protein INT45_009938 [Circinella minor]
MNNRVTIRQQLQQPSPVLFQALKEGVDVLSMSPIFENFIGDQNNELLGRIINESLQQFEKHEVEHELVTNNTMLLENQVIQDYVINDSTGYKHLVTVCSLKEQFPTIEREELFFTTQNSSRSSTVNYMELLLAPLEQCTVLIECLRQREQQQHFTAILYNSIIRSFESNNYSIQDHRLSESLTSSSHSNNIFNMRPLQEVFPSDYQYSQSLTEMQSNDKQAEVKNLQSGVLPEVHKRDNNLVHHDTFPHEVSFVTRFESTDTNKTTVEVASCDFSTVAPQNSQEENSDASSNLEIENLSSNDDSKNSTDYYVENNGI